MNQQDQQRISSFVDNELDSRQGQSLLNRLADDESFRRQLSNYQRIGDTLRQSQQDVEIDIVDAVHTRLHEEPTVLAPRSRHRPSIGQVALGTALAASVATVALIMAPQFLGQPTGSNESTIVFAPNNSSPIAQPVVMKRGANDKLSRYLVEHSEYSGRTGVNGPAPHVGFVSFDAR